MTHEELLAKIDQEVKDNEFACMVMAGAPAWILNSLRAVVELHNPFMGNTLELCKECSQLRKVDDPIITYPCRTIQAIEKELA